MINEIPHRLPHRSQLKKLAMRQPLFAAAPYLWDIFINILTPGVIDFPALFEPVVKGCWPSRRRVTTLIRFLRKDVAVACWNLNLTAGQFVIGTIVLATYFPCAATFSILVRELGVKDMLVSAALMIVTSLTAGTVMNLLLDRLLPPLHLAAVFVLLALLLIIAAGGTSDRRELRDYEAYLFNGNKAQKAGLD